MTVATADFVPPHVPAELVADFDLYDPPGFRDDYHLAFKRIKDSDLPPIFWTPRNGGHWVALRGADVEEVWKDYEHFSSRFGQIPRRENLPIEMVPIAADPPRHMVYRALIAPAFTPKMIGKLEKYARDTAKRLIDGFKARGQCEFITEFAQHMPIGIFLHIVNVPESEREHLLPMAEAQVRDPEKADEEMGKMIEYLRRLIAERRSHPGDDFVSTLITGQVDGRPVNDSELLGMLTIVFFGGLDTVASAMGFAAHFLATSPQHRRQLIEHPELLQNAADELLRRFPVANPARVVSRDYVFHGVHMKAGDMISLIPAFYNFEDSRFNDAMCVDFSRPAPIHLTFGAGAHRCPGSFLARTEIKIFMEEWLARIPDFNVEPGETVGLKAGINGTVTHLPLAWRN